MKILVLGAGGQVAHAVLKNVPEEYLVVAKHRSELDISDQFAIRDALDRFPADWIINCAAFTDVELAEVQREDASAINADAVGNLARAAADKRCRLLHFSSDFVFSGEANRAYIPSDKTGPVNHYGTSKLEGEQQIQINCRDAVVIRTAWLYSSGGRNFVLTMLRLMRERKSIAVVCDQIGSPTWATSLATATWKMISRSVAPGTYHWADLGVASWYDFAMAIQDEAIKRGLLFQCVPITPIPSADYAVKAVRPKFSVLDSSSTRTLLKLPANHWRHNLSLMMNELQT